MREYSIDLVDKNIEKVQSFDCAFVQGAKHG